MCVHACMRVCVCGHAGWTMVIYSVIMSKDLSPCLIIPYRDRHTQTAKRRESSVQGNISQTHILSGDTMRICYFCGIMGSHTRIPRLKATHAHTHVHAHAYATNPLFSYEIFTPDIAVSIYTIKAFHLSIQLVVIINAVKGL